MVSTTLGEVSMTASTQELQRAVEQRGARLDQYRSLLDRMEWVEHQDECGETYDQCPICDVNDYATRHIGVAPTPHEHDCELAIALGSLRKAPPIETVDNPRNFD
jgi:hypothetical protein